MVKERRRKIYRCSPAAPPEYEAGDISANRLHGFLPGLISGSRRLGFQIGRFCHHKVARRSQDEDCNRTGEERDLPSVLLGKPAGGDECQKNAHIPRAILYSHRRIEIVSGVCPGDGSHAHRMIETGEQTERKIE